MGRSISFTRNKVRYWRKNGCVNQIMITIEGECKREQAVKIPVSIMVGQVLEGKEEHSDPRVQASQAQIKIVDG